MLSRTDTLKFENHFNRTKKTYFARFTGVKLYKNKAFGMVLLVLSWTKKGLAYPFVKNLLKLLI